MSGCVCMCVLGYLFAHMRVHTGVCICGGQRTALRSQFFPYTMVSRDQIMLSGLCGKNFYLLSRLASTLTVVLLPGIKPTLERIFFKYACDEYVLGSSRLLSTE